MICSQVATSAEGLSPVAVRNSASNEKAAQDLSPDRDCSIARRSLRSKRFVGDDVLAQ